MTVEQFQNIAQINDSIFDETDKLALIICELYGFTPEQVDNFTTKKFLKYVAKMEKLFIKGFNKPFYSFNCYQTDSNKITLGQFIECQEWLKKQPIEVFHLLAASIYKGNRDNHKKLADKILKKNIKLILNDVTDFIDSLTKLIESYKTLFGSDDVQDEEEDLQEVKKKAKLKKHPFIEYHAWEYSATQVAAHNGITLNDSYNLPIIEALNNLVFLKHKQDYEQQQAK
jgi:hypothetical protein